jgi:DNA polymerase I-like protein with 3'-5' exonuclease and polymerase domains/uracil-DNA glycosylase
MPRPPLSDGPMNSKIWFIGGCPTASDRTTKKAFSNPSGRMLRQFCMQVGIDPTECFFGYVFPGAAPKDELKYLFKDGEPLPELAQSLASLNEEIEEFQPNVIVTLGAIPTYLLTTNTIRYEPKDRSFVGIFDWRGSAIPHKDFPDQKIIPAFDPSYIYHEGYSDHGIFLADLTKISAESQFEGIRQKERKLYLDPIGAERDESLHRLATEGTHITLDIEYIGSRLLCVGVTSDESWAACYGIHSPSDLDRIAEVLKLGKPINAQNAIFDLSILEYNYGLPLFEYLDYDTLIAAHALNPELPKDLGFLVSLYTDQPYHKSMVNWDLIKQGKQDFSILYEYCAIDAWTQHEIMVKQMKEDFTERPNAYKTFRFMMQLTPPLWEISKRGMLVDTEKLDAFKADLLFESQMLQHSLTVTCGREINVKSEGDVSYLLFDVLGLRPAGKTKTGKNKTDDKTLASLLGRVQNPQQAAIIGSIRTIRNNRDLISKFIDVEIDEDGRTRGMYVPYGTVTGRLASKKFYPTGKGHQQQNIPRAGRFALIPDRGMTFGSVDKERAESLVVAHETNDAIMLKHHEPGADAHRMLASLFFEVPEEAITKEQRIIMKQTRHAGNYLEGPITFMRSVNQAAHKTGVRITQKEAEKFIYWYRDIHTGLRPWWDRTRSILKESRTLSNKFGRERIFYGRIDAIIPEAIAYVPQSTIGDLLNIGLLNSTGEVSEIAKEILPWHEEIPEIGAELKSLGYQLLNQVHDSIGFQFPPEHETRITELLTRCLRIPLINPFTHEQYFIGDEFKFGKSWGEAS